MSQSRRKSTTKDPETDVYLSRSKTFFIGKEEEEEELFDVEKEEKEIIRLTKLIEPEYLRQPPADDSLLEAHLKTAISESHQDLRIVKKPLEYLENIAADLVGFTNSNTHHDHSILNDIDHHVRDLIEDKILVEFRKDQLEELRELIHSSNHRTTTHHPKRNNNLFSDNGFIDVNSILCKKLSSHLSAWDSKSLRQKFAQDPSYKSFQERLWEARGSQEVMPPIKSFLPAGEGEDSSESSGEELEIAGGTQNYKCPLCIGFLKEPMRSQLCNHTFCKGCFQGYLEQNRSEDAPCPTSGCSKMLSLSTVLFDESLALRIKQLQRRQQFRENTQDIFDDERPNSNLIDDDDDSKPNHLNPPKASSSLTQRKRRVVVDDDDDDD